MSEIKGLADAIERGAMTAPRTAAGRALLDEQQAAWGHDQSWNGSVGKEWRKAILAIEAEADRATVERIRAAVGDSVPWRSQIYAILDKEAGVPKRDERHQILDDLFPVDR